MIPLLLAAALAAEPTPPPYHPGAEDEAGPIDVSGWSVLAYNGYLVDSSFRVSTDLKKAVDGLPREPDAAALAAFRKKLHDAFALAEGRLVRLPAWEGDAAFRDTALGAVRWALGVVDTDVVELHELVSKPVVTDADLARAEALVKGIDDTAATWDGRLKDAQRAFAASAGFTLTEGAPAAKPKDPARFTAPGIPPAGSHLQAVVHVGFATRYHNGLVTSEVALVDAFNAYVAAMAEPGDAAVHAAADAFEVARQVEADVRRVGPWQGDAGLRDAVLDVARVLQRLLAGPGKDAADVNARTAPTPVDQEARNLAIGVVNQESVAAFRRFDAAVAAFKARWGMAAYEAWRAAHP